MSLSRIPRPGHGIADGPVHFPTCALALYPREEPRGPIEAPPAPPRSIRPPHLFRGDDPAATSPADVAGESFADDLFAAIAADDAAPRTSARHVLDGIAAPAPIAEEGGGL